MSGEPEFLENGELHELVNSQGDAARMCEEAILKAKKRIEAFVCDLDPLAHACMRALRDIEEEIGGLIDKVTPQGYSFVDRAAVYAHVCGFLVRMEELRGALEQTLFPLSCAGELLVDAREAFLSAQMIASVAGHGSEMKDMEARLDMAGHRFVGLHRQIMELCSATLPRFLERLYKGADLPHKGDCCDTASVLRLCDALLFSVRQMDFERE